jgi:hypothetical protein
LPSLSVLRRNALPTLRPRLRRSARQPARRRTTRPT